MKCLKSASIAPLPFLAERKAKGPAQRAAGGSVIKELGRASLTMAKPVRVMDGRFGPYVKYDKGQCDHSEGRKPRRDYAWNAGWN